MAEVDWSRLGKTLLLRRLLPTLGPRIVELGDGGASEAFAAAVERATVDGRRQGAFLQLVSLRMTAALGEAGIRCAALKGPLLSEALYGDPGRRISGDIDLLVPAEQLRAAADTVRGLGYAAPADHTREGDLPLLHLVLPHELGRLPPVELHWRIHWYERDFARERLLPPPGAPSEWRPAPVDQLIALLLYYARDGFVDLRLATDLGAWWDAFGAELRPGALEERLRVHPALARAVRAAIAVAERVVGLPGAQILEGAPGLTVRNRVAVRLANPNPHASPSQIYADMGLIDGLLMPPRGLWAFLRRQVFLPREVLDLRASQVAQWQARSPLGHTVGVLARYAVTVTRLLRTPETLG